MRMQSSQANCGSTALHNALLALGKHRSPEECEILCATNATDGTYAVMLVNAISTIRGCHPVVINGREARLSMFLLNEALMNGRSVITCVDEHEHYIACIGLLGQRIVIADSADNELVRTMKQIKFQDRWAPDYWGVIL